MADTNFIDQKTVIEADWLNDVNQLAYAKTYPDGTHSPTSESLATSSGASGVGFQQSGTGAVLRTVESKFWESISVKDFGAVGDGVADDTLAIQKAIDAGKPYSTSTSGRCVFLPSGRYKVSASIDLSGCHGVYLVGAGPYATEIFAAGDFSVVSGIGTYAAPLNKAGVSKMTIRGFGAESSSGHGVELQWANHCYLDNLIIFGCRHGLSLHHQWQTSLYNISIHGAGADQSYIGVYLGLSDLTYIDNAVQAFNVFVQGTSGYGFRIINGQGSKFANCEAGGAPMVNAWYIGEPPSGTVKCQWLHFTNCLGDSTVGPAWLIRQGTASELSQLQLSNCWGGNSDRGFYLDGVTFSALNGLIASGNTNAGMLTNNCSHLTVSGCVLTGNNEAASAAVGDFQIQGSSYLKVTSNISNSNSAGKSYLESGSSNNNTLSDNSLLQGATLVGANNQVRSNIGFKTSNTGSSTITSGTTSVVASHGLAVTPSINNIRVTPRDNMGSATKFWISAVGASSFTINVNIDPGTSITFGWAVDYNV